MEGELFNAVRTPLDCGSYFGPECVDLKAAKRNIIKCLEARINYLYFVKGNNFNMGERCWYYMLVDPDKQEAFLEQSNTGSVDVYDYGKVLYSGWGENPIQNITNKFRLFKERISNDLFLIMGEDKSSYYVLVDPDKKEMFQEQSKKGSGFVKNIESYGKVLYSGWGQDLPECFIDRIARACFYMDETDLEENFAGLSVENNNPLHDAARDCELETIRHLIRKGVNVNSTGKNGWTPLHHAAYVGNLEVAKFLIDSGADLHVKDTVCGRKPIHIAAREGKTGIVRLFLNKGIGVNDADENSWTPLRYAVWNGHLETAKLLINERADIHARDAMYGKKLIHIAAEKGYMDVMNLFLENNFSVDDADKENRTSLHYAALNGHLEVVKFLVDKGANIHAEKKGGVKPQHSAFAHQEIIEFLLSKGASVDDETEGGWTLLHFAAHDGQSEVIKFLIEKGADIHVRDDESKTPYIIAREKGHREVLDILDVAERGKSHLYFSA